ncbi:Transglutaminase-like enzyme, putative cysteine protease [Tistlia consotensis]|uniref:Transglutaminase-like enzyme, putative cysteine protease n=1 Tax=Tistlia consotensis USBA 355 TaxID=560819 RepID=A0A1Y6CCH6_9PROT|nr:transglutaminase family protein [Tistlia consotensis]SMF48245.1 Transglutaminase-like enzyme, putative cysteine protease [Tistlia consotensis USBA 355]SNR81534.1 Transglutaminase-like enzyme, putative cysteine protease [Tistlia consotensis]
MTVIRVRHETRYRYDRPVTLGEHRLMIRPRDGHDLRLLEAGLRITPPALVRWSFDTFGNSIARAFFEGETEELVIENDLLVRRYVFDDPLVTFAEAAEPYPFAYRDDERVDLAPLIALQHPEERELVAGWRARTLPQLPGSSLDLLHALGQAIHDGFAYSRREALGTQSPRQTLERGEGTCRDFAFLFMEAARDLGFAARFVTGYLHDATLESGDDGLAGGQAGGQAGGHVGGGATHAWAEVFVPGAGWLEFDPTNLIVAGRDLVRVATTRTPEQARPISGSFRGPEATQATMAVTVEVTREMGEAD